jgi:hypothetical protein
MHLLSVIEDMSDEGRSGEVRKANLENALKRLRRALENAVRITGKREAPQGSYARECTCRSAK